MKWRDLTAWLAHRMRAEASLEPRRVSLPWIDAQFLGQVQENPTNLPRLYSRHLEQWRLALGWQFACCTEREREWLFCFMFAHACAPWGSLPPVFGLAEMLRAPALSCANYGVLGWRLAKLFANRVEDAALNVHFVGWESAAIGNHQLLFLSKSGDLRGVLIDPTIGLVAHATFDDVASGVRIAVDGMTLFDPRPELKAFEQLVLSGLASGSLRASELLYYFDDPEHLAAVFRDPDVWPTPGAIAWRRRQA